MVHEPLLQPAHPPALQHHAGGDHHPVAGGACWWCRVGLVTGKEEGVTEWI